MRRPSEREYAPFYQRYVNLTRGANYLELLQDSGDEVLHLFDQITEEQALATYAPGKWTLKELLQHLIDCDTIFAYRALRLSRRDNTGLEGFEEDDYVRNSRANARTLGSLLEDYRNLRAYIIGMFKSFDTAQLDFEGKLLGHTTSTLAIGFIIAGHTFHHLEVIKNRYL